MKLQLRPTVLFRTPAFPIDANLNDSWESLKEAILISSPTFFEFIKDYNANQIEEMPERIGFSVWKYFNRAKYRATPYGVFAGFGTAMLSNDNTKLIIENRQKLHAFADWNQKDSIRISRDLSNQRLSSNSTFYVFGDVIRYVSRFDNHFQLSEIDFDSVVIDVLNACNKPEFYEGLLKVLLSHNIPLRKSRKLIRELVKLQLLISEAQPNIIGRDYFERIGFKSPIKGSQYLLAERKVSEGSIDISTFKGLQSMIEYIHSVKPKDEQAALNTFTKRFKKKFEMNEVPLMTALDPEIGVGYDDLENANDGDDFINHFIAPSSEGNTGKSDGLQEYFLRALLTAKQQGSKVIELESIKLPLITEPLPLPNSLSCLVSPCNGLNWINSIGGPTANALTGRFTLASDQILDQCRQNAAMEAAANTGVLFFDLAYMGEGRVDNINRRQTIYNHNLSILNYDTSDAPLAMYDLMVSFNGSEIILRSKSYGCRMVPRLTKDANGYHIWTQNNPNKLVLDRTQLIMRQGVQQDPNSDPLIKSDNTMQGAWALSFSLLMDDATVAGIADDIAIPVILVTAYVATHGNSKNSPKPNIVYEIYRVNSITGYKTMKYGVSGQADFVQFSGNPRPEYQCAALNVIALGQGQGDTYWYSIVARTADRASALELERQYVNEYFAAHGEKPEMQQRP